MIGNCKNLDTMLSEALMSEWNIGVDIIEIARFQQLQYQSNKQFYTRIFTPKEIGYCLSFSSPEPHFAANFAGKEAIYKAVSMFYDININKIEILRDEKASPIVNLHLDPKEKLEPINVKVSLSHSLSHAVAFAVAHKVTKGANKNRKAEAVSPHGR